MADESATVSTQRGFGYWLCMLVLVTGYPGILGGVFASVVSVCFFLVSLVVVYQAVRLHPRGWEWVRMFSFAGAWAWGILFLVAILTRAPEGAELVSTLGLGVATVAWLWVFQYFRRDAVQRLFPYG